MTFDGEKTYEYDWKNRMTAVKISGIPVAAYTYDALNRRVTKITDATRRFYYEEGRVIEEYVDNVLERSYVYGACIDDSILTEYQGARYFYIKNRNYSIAAITDADGNIIETCDYSAFGLMKITDAAGNEISESTIGNPYGYTGRRRDPETGLWYYRNRMYSPTLGRFLQRDPAGYVDGMCLYAYVKNNPIGFVDPWGLCAEISFWATIKKIGSGIEQSVGSACHDIIYNEDLHTGLKRTFVGVVRTTLDVVVITSTDVIAAPLFSKYITLPYGTTQSFNIINNYYSLGDRACKLSKDLEFVFY